MIRLSKSRYCNGVQCPKMIWMKDNKMEVAEDVMDPAVLKNGNMVGDLARSYFGEFKDAERLLETGGLNIPAMLSVTKQLLNSDAQNIAEASFSVDGLFCAVDILHRDGDGWDIAEVKSSTEQKEVYFDDMSFQLYVLRKCGLNIKKVYLLHVNNQYVLHGQLNLQEYLTLVDATDKCESKQIEVERNIENIREFCNTKEEPEYGIGIHCEKPYLCPFYKYCRGELPELSVFDIHSRIQAKKRYELITDGMLSLEDVYMQQPKLSNSQWQEIECALGKKQDIIDKAGIKSFLGTLSYPIYHLDFETFADAIPRFEGQKPFMQIPFQYSLHIEQADGSLEHKEFLAKEGTDPRREIAEALCRDIPMNACSTAYNMSFEVGRLGELAELFPDLAEHLRNISDNMRDLLVPFTKRYYYTKDMHGSASIKSVLPALYPDDPELNYHNLEGIQKGDQASAAFVDLHTKTPEEIADVREQLLKYCGLDTYAMVKVLKKLKEAVQ